jgi:hypothetical protein
MICEHYNGWTNRATWNIALWLQNDETLYTRAAVAVDFMNRRGDLDKSLTKDWAKSFVTVEFENVFGKAVSPDGIDASDQDIDWHQIINVFFAMAD